MKIGFIGTGAIAEAMIDGLCGVAGHDGPILVTRRSEARSARLAGKFANVSRTDDAQAIVEASDVVVLGVLPKQGIALLEMLRFREGQHLLSLVAGLKLETLRSLAAPASVQRAVPMPPIALGLGPLPMCPPDPRTRALFEGTGEVIALDDEETFETVWAGTSLMACFFALVARTAAWMERNGVPAEAAAHDARSMFHALATLAGEADAATLQDMAQECITPGGLNEQVMAQLETAGWLEEIDTALDAIRDRLRRASAGV